MKKFYGIPAIVFLLCITGRMFPATAEEIVSNLDNQSLITNDFEMTIRVDGYKNGQFEDSAVMEGYVTNCKMYLITYISPPRMKGLKILIHDNDIWISVPNTKNPIKITAAQRLMGGISFGDIARISYGLDYSAVLKGEDELIKSLDAGGNPAGDVKCYNLEFTAREEGSSYNKIIMWADEESFLPVKADFYALSGKKMTTVYYTAPKIWAGRNVITKMFLFDQVFTNKYSTMEYLDIKFPAGGTNETETETN